MTSSEQAPPRLRWISVLLSPRAAVADVLTGSSQSEILLLACFGAIVGLMAQFISFGFTTALLDWRLLLGFVVVGAIYGVVSLYLAALVLRAIGSAIGGRAGAEDLRKIVAWGMLPGILGVAVVLAILAVLKLAGGGSGANAEALVAIGAVTGLFGLWSAIVLMLMLSRLQGFGFGRTLISYLLYLLVFWLVAVVIRSFLFQPFNMPSRSMEPTLLEGDYFFVSKYAYGYNQYSFPVWPSFSGRIFGSEPARGDVVVFRLPKDDKTDYVKRVVGLPGDRIQMKDGLLYINDVAVKREPLPEFVGDDPCGSAAAAKVKRWRETLPNGASHETLDCVDNGFYDNTPVYAVPPDHFFTLGDNRDNSSDSRVLSQIGYIPFDHLIGRVGMIFFSATRESARVGRLGTNIH